MLLRRPELLSAPRFWAEEGQVYFAHAFNTSFVANLFSQFYGYYTLIPNLATGLAVLAPLHLAPYITTIIALLVQLQVCSLALLSRSAFWGSQFQKGILCLAIILVSTGDVWLNTINSMYWLAIGTFFILLEEEGNTHRVTLWHRRFYLLFAGLTGVVSCFMTPVFALKAWHTREREQAIRTAILAGCALLQLAVLATAYLTGNSMLGERFTADSFSLQRVLVLNFFDPFALAQWLNWEPVLRFDEHFLPLTRALADGQQLHFFRVSVMMIESFIVAFFLWLFYSNRNHRGYRYLLLSYLLVTVLSTVSSLRMESAPRYVLAPSCMLLTALVGTFSASLQQSRWQQWGTRLMFAMILLITALNFRPKINRYFTPDISWPDEVSRWRSNTGYSPRIWPPGWAVELRRR